MLVPETSVFHSKNASDALKIVTTPRANHIARGCETEANSYKSKSAHTTSTGSRSMSDLWRVSSVRVRKIVTRHQDMRVRKSGAQKVDATAAGGHQSQRRGGRGIRREKNMTIGRDQANDAAVRYGLIEGTRTRAGIPTCTRTLTRTHTHTHTHTLTLTHTHTHTYTHMYTHQCTAVSIVEHTQKRCFHKSSGTKKTCSSIRYHKGFFQLIDRVHEMDVLGRV
jgi:hypothetical protein